MTAGRSGPTGTRQTPLHAVDVLAAQGLARDEIVLCDAPLGGRLAEPDLEPASFRPEFAPLVRRLQAQMGGGRALSVLVAGPRDAAVARTRTALQVALGSIPSGRNVVVVDADFARPGLGGLLADPMAEGLTDMVWFGRSLTPLLQQPVPEGPWLLPAGSFPEEEPLPLQGDELRSALYRVAQRCDLALYVAPTHAGAEFHPLASMCDQTILVGEDDGGAELAALADTVRELRQRQARLAGVAVYGRRDPETAARFAPGFIAAPEPPPPVEEAAVAMREAETEEREETGRSVFEPPELILPPVPQSSSTGLPGGPSLDWGSPFEPAGAGEPAERGTVATRRTREEARGASRALEQDRGEFAVEEEAPPSRWPLFLVVAMLVMILGFVSWAFWNRQQQRAEESRTTEALPPATEPGATLHPTPPSQGKEPSAPPAGGAGLDDRAAAGAGRPQTTTQPPATSPPKQETTPPVQAPSAPPAPAPTPPAAGAGSTAGKETSPGAGSTSTPTRPAPPASAASGSSTGTVFAVWVASYKTLAKAEVEIRALEKRGYTGRAVQTDLGDMGIWYRVYAGSYATSAEAAAARDALLQLPDYKFAQVRRLPRN